jgi:hypothetical protein
MRVAWGHEEARGHQVLDVSLPELAIAMGLESWPGFDLLSRPPKGEALAVEVKGRMGIGEIEVSENEWAKACNLRSRYWLYVVFNCASSHPELHRVQDPFGKLITRARGGVVLDASAILQTAERLP